MKLKDVPQDNSKTYSGHNKLIYAKSETGQYVSAKSSGWEVEESATLDAVDFYNDLAAQAYLKVKVKDYSPLYFYMFKQRMDLPLLAQTTGYFQWQIKRHFKPKVFGGLSDSKLQRYCDAMNLSLTELKTLPETP